MPSERKSIFRTMPWGKRFTWFRNWGSPKPISLIFRTSWASTRRWRHYCPRASILPTMDRLSNVEKKKGLFAYFCCAKQRLLMNFDTSEITAQVGQTARDSAQQHIRPHV